MGVGQRDEKGTKVISPNVLAFFRVSYVHHIIVVVAKEHINEMRRIVSYSHYGHDEKSITIVTGGETRHRSISKGVEAISNITKSKYHIMF